MKESTEWPLHLVIQWQMDLQFSARLSGNKEHFHFRQEAASVQSSSIRLFKQLQTLHTSLAWLLQLPHSRRVLLYCNCLWFYLFTALPILLRTGHSWATSWAVCSPPVSCFWLQLHHPGVSNVGTWDSGRVSTTAAEGFAHPQSTTAAGSEVLRLKWWFNT